MLNFSWDEEHSDQSQTAVMKFSSTDPFSENIRMFEGKTSGGRIRQTFLIHINKKKIIFCT